ncbi:hypothetical protein CLOM_g4519 [Closterium sp. NIES-68]|nr:hypothetical protein CLOM_g4519 [Closterium sp. NIES-68]
MTERTALINSMGTDGADSKDQAEGQVHVPEERGWSKFWAYVGPGFLVAIAYIDPANFESDLKAGAAYQYSLLWVLLLASLAGLLIQSLSANLGIVTGKHLAQHCQGGVSPGCQPGAVGDS